MSYYEPDPDNFFVDVGYRDPLDGRDDVPDDDGPDRPMSMGRERWLVSLGRWEGGRDD